MYSYEPKELNDFPTFFEIPRFSNYGINKQGHIINKKTKRIMVGCANHFGYYRHQLTGDNGKRYVLKRHRITALVFKRPHIDPDTLHVNHINGIKGDDDIDNLEWVTPKENAIHASQMGNYPIPIPIASRNVDTGEVLYFDTLISCARHHGITRDAIQRRYRSGEDIVWPERQQYRSGNIIRPWIIPDDIEKSWMSHDHCQKVLLRNILTNEIKEFDKMNDLAKFLGVVPSVITSWTSKPNQPILPGFYQVKKGSDKSPWREISDPYSEIQKASKYEKVVKVIDHVNKTEHIFLSAVECAKKCNLKPTALGYRLKSNGKTIFSDGCSYEYYSV